MRKNLSAATRLRIFRRDQGVCGICGEPVSFDALNVDHVVDWSVGGADDDVNLRATHRACNRGRPARRRTRPFAPGERPLVNVKGLDPDLWKWLRLKAVQQGRPMGEVLNDILREARQREQSPTDPERP